MFWVRPPLLTSRRGVKILGGSTPGFGQNQPPLPVVLSCGGMQPEFLVQQLLGGDSTTPYHTCVQGDYQRVPELIGDNPQHSDSLMLRVLRRASVL